MFSDRRRPSLAARSRCSVASTGSSGMPSHRAMTFVAPPGMMPSDVSVPASAFRASLMVPSPENTTTRSNPPATASRASSVAWPRAFVSWTSSLKSDCNARSMTSRRGRETVLATGFARSITRSGRFMGSPTSDEPPETGGSSATSSPSCSRWSSPARSPFTTTEPAPAMSPNRAPNFSVRASTLSAALGTLIP